MEPTIQYIQKELKNLYPAEEIRGFIRLIFEHVCQMSYTEQILRRKEHLDEACKSKIEAIVKRLKTFEPIQYILGETEFLDLSLRVNASVLIPRPETEELVQWIIDSGHPSLSSVLDVGTGSGCIALALKKRFKSARVTAVDFSEEALNTARENARKNRLNVEFFRGDILNWEKTNWEMTSLIVSNPPYIRKEERKMMAPNVLDYEPEHALFVPDCDPLIFYREIAGLAAQKLRKKGWLYFEINENSGTQMEELMKKAGFLKIELKKDIRGKIRMLRAQK